MSARMFTPVASWIRRAHPMLRSKMNVVPFFVGDSLTHLQSPIPNPQSLLSSLRRAEQHGDDGHAGRVAVAHQHVGNHVSGKRVSGRTVRDVELGSALEDIPMHEHGAAGIDERHVGPLVRVEDQNIEVIAHQVASGGRLPGNDHGRRGDGRSSPSPPSIVHALPFTVASMLHRAPPVQATSTLPVTMLWPAPSVTTPVFASVLVVSEPGRPGRNFVLEPPRRRPNRSGC